MGAALSLPRPEYCTGLSIKCRDGRCCHPSVALFVLLCFLRPSASIEMSNVAGELLIMYSHLLQQCRALFRRHVGVLSSQSTVVFFSLAPVTKSSSAGDLCPQLRPSLWSELSIYKKEMLFVCVAAASFWDIRSSCRDSLNSDSKFKSAPCVASTLS